MTINLTSYKSIESNLFVKIEVEYYKSTPSSTPTSVDLLFTDRIQSTVINGDTYVGLGKLISISTSNSELRASGSDVTITLSGIPNSSIAEVLNSRIKGSAVTITRGLFNSETGQFLSSVVGNPVTRFKGFVNNLALDEEYNVDSRQSSNTLVLSCASIVTVLENKISGRKTNTASMNKFFPSDTSMDRVATLESSYFDFGAKQ
jgi:hypothetical protein